MVYGQTVYGEEYNIPAVGVPAMGLKKFHRSWCILVMAADVASII